MKASEYLEAAKKNFESAEMHKKAAETASETGQYGIPVSLLILSTEQSISGILIYAQHFGFKLKDIPRIHLFFSDHIIKHRLAILISVVYSSMKIMMETVEKSRDQISGRIKITGYEETFVREAKKEAFALFRTLPEMFDWWDNANLQKNRGFYVDYSNSIETPMQVTENEYIVAHRIVENFQHQILQIFQYLESIPEENKEVVKNTKIEERITEIIASHRKEMKNLNSIITSKESPQKKVKDSKD
jgi:AbiV family abortive infection protein